MNATKTRREGISFSRCSSPKQKKGTTFTRQHDGYDAVCERYKDKVFPSIRFTFGAFKTVGSGFKGVHLKKGGALRKFLDMIHSGEINPHETALIIDEWSRFARMKPLKTMALLQEVVESGCVLIVYSPDMWVDELTANSIQFVQISVMVQMAYEESCRKSHHQKAVRQYAREGKKRTKACPKWITLEGCSSSIP